VAIASSPFAANWTCVDDATLAGSQRDCHALGFPLGVLP
jgi:hypothetical protein